MFRKRKNVIGRFLYNHSTHHLMKIALFGAHGTGKTTTIKLIQERFPDYFYVGEFARHQAQSFGYSSPWQIEKEVGEAVLEPMLMNSFAVIDPKANPLLGQNHVVLDRSPIDYYAYYLTERKTEQDHGIEKLLKSMAQHYSSLIDRFVYFPIGIFPLQGDAMRPESISYQETVNRNMVKAIGELEISPEKIHQLRAVEPQERAEEIIALLK